MNKNSVFNKFLEVLKEYCGIGVFRHSFYEKLPDVPEKMCAAFLFRESLYGISVGGIEIGDKDTVVKFSEVRFDNRRRPMLVNVEKRYLIVREYPEPVALPSGLVHMDILGFGKRLFQRLVKCAIRVKPYTINYCALLGSNLGC